MTTYIIIHIICGIIAYGATLAYFQREFSAISEEGWKEHFRFAIFVGVSGPIGFLLSFILSDFYKHGFKFW